MSIRAIIIDDERKARESLTLLLNKIEPQVHICVTVSSVDEAVSAIKRFCPEIVFLDIEMPEESGFFLFEKLGGIINFETIFTTAHSSYAVDAFKVNALDYILKPVVPQELQRVVQKALKKLSSSSSVVEGGAFQDGYGKKTGSDFKVFQYEKLMVPSMDGVRFFPLDEIIRLEADGAYTRIFFKAQLSFLSSKNLGDYEEKLRNYKNFTRIHRSTIINLREVLHFNESRNITMSDSSVVVVSRWNKKSFLNGMKVVCARETTART